MHPSALEQQLVRRLEDPAQARSERARSRTVRHLRLQALRATRVLSVDHGSALLLSLVNRCLSLLERTPVRPLYTQLGALSLIDALLDVPPSGSSETLLIRVANALRLLLQQTNEPQMLRAAAAALGHLARLGSPLTLDLVTFQVKQAFEWLQQSAGGRGNASASASTSGSASSATSVAGNSDMRELAAVMVLKQLAASVPTLFNPHVPQFLDLIWTPVHSLRPDVREAAVLAMRVCLVDIAARGERWRRTCYLRIFAAAQAGLQSDTRKRHAERKSLEADVAPSHDRASYDPAITTARIHGSLLILGELMELASADFLAPRFRTLTDMLMQHRHDSSKSVQRCVITLLPKAAQLCPADFERDYLADTVAYLSRYLESDERDTAFLALGRLAASMSDALLPSLPPLLSHLTASLRLTVGLEPSTAAPPSSAKSSSFFGLSLIFGGVGGGTAKPELEDDEPVEPHAERNRRYRRFTHAAMACVGMLAQALGEQLRPHCMPLIDAMMSTGLSQSLVDTLRSIDRLLDLLSTLLEQAWSLSPQQRSLAPPPPPPVAPTPTSYSFGFGFKAPVPIPERVGAYQAPDVKAFQPTLPGGRVAIALLPPSSRLTAIRTPAAVAEHDRGAILLALRTVAAFDWRGQELVLLPLAKEILQPFLQEQEDDIRLQAAVTMAALVRTLAEACALTPLSERVFDLLKPLVVLCVSDSSALLRLSLLTSFSAPPTPQQQQLQLQAASSASYGDDTMRVGKQRQQTLLELYLCQSELLSSLALCLNDESFIIRERVLALLSSLASRNPMLVLPILRAFLLQLLHSLQHQPDDVDDSGAASLHAQSDVLEAAALDAEFDTAAGTAAMQATLPVPVPLSEQHAKLLLTLISYPGGEKLCRSHAHAILQVLLPKLTHILTMYSSSARRAQPALLASLSTAASAALSSLPHSSQLASYILSTLGKLSIVAGSDMRPSISLLLQLIVDTLQEQVSGAAAAPDDEEAMLKRTVAIRTLGQLVASTGNVIQPWMEYPSLLPTLLRLLQDDRTGGRGNDGMRGKRLLTNDNGDDSSSPSRGSLLPSLHYPSLSSTFLSRSSQREFRVELLKLLAKIGALNPYRFRHSLTLQLLQSAEAHHQTSLTGAPIAATAPALGEAHFLDAEPQLCELMAQADMEGIDSQTILHEEYFPSVALRALLRILLNPRLAYLHGLVLRAILFIFRSLGSAKSTQYLPSVMPFLLHEMSTLATQAVPIPAAVVGPVVQMYDVSPASSPHSNSSGGMAALPAHGLQLSYLQHLTALTQIVSFNMRPYLARLFDILFVGQPYGAPDPHVDGTGLSLQLPYWSEPALTSSILRLVEVIALSLRAGGADDEFKNCYQPLIMSKLLQLLQHAEQNLAATQEPSSASAAPRYTHMHPAHATHVLLLKVLHTIRVLGGSGRDALAEFLHTLLPTLLRVLERSLQHLPRETDTTSRPRSSTSAHASQLQTPASASTGYKLCVSVVQTLSVLGHLHDCSLHASRIISALCRFFKTPHLQPSSLTEACLELLCVLLAQLGFDFLLFYEQPLQSALHPLSRRYDAIRESPLPNHTVTRSPRVGTAATGTPTGRTPPRQPQNKPHARNPSVSSNEGSLSAASSPGSGRLSASVRKSPSVLSLDGSFVVEAPAPPANHLQRFQSLLAQLKARVAEVRDEKQLPAQATTEDRSGGDSDSALSAPRSAPSPDLSSKDWFHSLMLTDALDVPVADASADAHEEEMGSLPSSMSSRTSSFTDLASLAEHEGESDGESSSPHIQATVPGPKKLRMSQSNLQRAWTANARSTRDDWHVWMRGFSLELLKQSPSPSLRACSFLAQKYPSLASTLFNAAFLACWPELSDAYQDDLIRNLEFLFLRAAVGAMPAGLSPEGSDADAAAPARSSHPLPSPTASPSRRMSAAPIVGRSGVSSSSTVPSSIMASLLALCEFTERMECSLPLSIGLLSALSVRCHAFATALHFQELEFQQTAAVTQLAAIAATPSDLNLASLASVDGTGAASAASIRQAEHIIESLITINNKLGQKDAADGILKLVRSQQKQAMQRSSSSRGSSGGADGASSDNPLMGRQRQVLLHPSWYEKLQRWEDALEAYEQRQDELMRSMFPDSSASPIDSLLSPEASSPSLSAMAEEGPGTGEFIETQLGKMRCLRALGEWEELAQLAQGLWNRTDDPVVRRELCPLAAAAACNLHRWDSMEPLLLFFDEDGSAAAAAASSSLLSGTRGASARPGSDRRHRFDANYYASIFLIHRARYAEARQHLDRAVEVLDPQLTALAGESYPRAYKSFLLLQRVAQLEEVIDFKQAGEGVAPSSSSPAPLTPRQTLLQRMWSTRMLEGLSRSGEDIDTWSELLMQQQLLRAPGSPYYSEYNLSLYLELCEISRKQAMEMGTAATDVPLPSTSLSGAPRTQNPFLARGAHILHNLLGFSPLELLPDASGTSASHVPSMRRMQQVMENTRPRTKLPHLLFAVWKNLYAQGYRVQAFHRLRDMVSGPLDNDVFPRALREALSTSMLMGSGQGSVPFDASVSAYRGVTELDQLKALCYIRLGKWQISMLDESISQQAAAMHVDSSGPRTPYSPYPTSSSFTFSYPAADAPTVSPPSFHATASRSLHETLDFFRLSTVLDPSSVRAWHEYGMLLAKVSTGWKSLLAQQQQQQQQPTVTSIPTMHRSSSVPALQPTHHIVAAIHAFFRSISLQPVSDNSLQDVLRVLALWFEYGASETVDDKEAAVHVTSASTSPIMSPLPLADPPSTISAAIRHGMSLIAVEHWLNVIPQLIARIHVSSPAIRRLLLELLCRVGRAHPQALIYPLTVASKSPLESRRRSALSVLDHMRTHSSTLVAQAALVSTQLVRVAILWEEMWHEGLEEASRVWYGAKDFPAMMRILQPLHALMDQRDGMSIREAAFLSTYGKELAEALDSCRKYERSTAAAAALAADPSASSADAPARAKAEKQHLRHASSCMSRAWEIYTQVFRKLAKQIQQTHELELSDISAPLLLSRDLELAVPGSYRAGANVVRISMVEPLLRVIDSKQHPRRLCMLGSDGHSYTFLLKGHEDLRQDERVMQLFGLVNTLLQADHATAKSDLSIRRFAVVPISPNSGLIEWVKNSDTIHTVIKRYRDARAILLNIEQRLMLKHAPDYHLCTIAQRIEIFEYALHMTGGQDLANVMWLNAPTSEVWLERRVTFTRTCAVMSMVGYILGLGDRHTCNLLLDKSTGACVHIDFGDCFEVSAQRERFPEKVPFRLTRMFRHAMEVAGIEGTFRSTAERVMRVLRKNKNSIMAVLEAFSLDPLLNWRLLDVRKKQQQQSAVAVTPGTQRQGHAQAEGQTQHGATGAAPSTAIVGHPQQPPLPPPVPAPHSHVDVAESNIVPVVAEHLRISQDALASQAAADARGAMPPPPAPSSILGLLVHIPLERERERAMGSGIAAGLPQPVPTAAAPTAASAHSKAEACIVAAAAEPGFGPDAARSGGLGAVDEGDEVEHAYAAREMPPSPVQRRRSVVDESALGLIRGDSLPCAVGGGGSCVHVGASAAAAHSRLEQLNQQAQVVMARVDAKLKGAEWATEASGSLSQLGPHVIRIVGFHIGARQPATPSDGSESPSSASSLGLSAGPLPPPPTLAPSLPAVSAPLSVAAQVDRLIAEATSTTNLAQAYIGWCPFW